MFDIITGNYSFTNVYTSKQLLKFSTRVQNIIYQKFRVITFYLSSIGFIGNTFDNLFFTDIQKVLVIHAQSAYRHVSDTTKIHDITTVLVLTVFFAE
jgi:hypothetical protein